MKDDELKKQEVVLDLYMLQIKASIAQIFKMEVKGANQLYSLVNDMFFYYDNELFCGGGSYNQERNLMTEQTAIEFVDFCVEQFGIAFCR